MKHEWVAPLCLALESGEYSQITVALHTPQGFCCLGVACELVLGKQDEMFHQVPWQATTRDFNNVPLQCFELFGDVFSLPPQVMTALGFRTDTGRFELPQAMRGTSRVACSLAQLNDDGFTFPQIADCIRYFWKEL